MDLRAYNIWLKFKIATVKTLTNQSCFNCTFKIVAERRYLALIQRYRFGRHKRQNFIRHTLQTQIEIDYRIFGG